MYAGGVHEKLIGKWVNDIMDGWGTMINRNGDRWAALKLKPKP